VAVVGPTGSGKSGLAIHLALQFDGEVVNCDSVQVYRRFDIGTAKVPAAERQGVAHHLVDVCGPADLFTAGDYSRLARSAIADITARGRLPIVCGGTGFYLRALLRGLFEGPPRNPELRARLLARRPGSLHRLLSRFDPVAAEKIHANDTNKLVRALEVALTAGRPLSELHAEGRDELAGYATLLIGLDPPRGELYNVLDARVVEMYHSGLVEEVRAMLADGVPADARGLESLGYAQAVRLLRGEVALDQAVADTQLQTRRYAKRQWTWFRREEGVAWLEGFGGDDGVRRAAAEKVRALLEQIAESSV
jgi:tRNA dimethylallyltransferase